MCWWWRSIRFSHCDDVGEEKVRQKQRRKVGSLEQIEEHKRVDSLGSNVRALGVGSIGLVITCEMYYWLSTFGKNNE